MRLVAVICFRGNHQMPMRHRKAGMFVRNMMVLVGTGEGKVQQASCKEPDLENQAQSRNRFTQFSLHHRRSRPMHISKLDHPKPPILSI